MGVVVDGPGWLCVCVCWISSGAGVVSSSSSSSSRFPEKSSGPLCSCGGPS